MTPALETLDEVHESQIHGSSIHWKLFLFKCRAFHSLGRSPRAVSFCFFLFPICSHKALKGFPSFLHITTLLFHMLCPKVLPLFSPLIGGWAKGGRHSNPLKRNFYFGELPKFQFVLGDGPIKKWLITIQIIYI